MVVFPFSCNLISMLPRIAKILFKWLTIKKEEKKEKEEKEEE